MRLDQADEALLRELSSVLIELCVRAERDSPVLGPRDDRLCELLSRADLALWQTFQRLEPF